MTQLPFSLRSRKLLLLLPFPAKVELMISDDCKENGMFSLQSQ